MSQFLQYVRSASIPQTAPGTVTVTAVGLAVLLMALSVWNRVTRDMCNQQQMPSAKHVGIVLLLYY